MAVWEFRLVTDDATILDQTIVAEGQDETQAAASAKTLIEEKSSVALFRPGLSVSLDIAARWQEVCDGAFPCVFNNASRLARYARGVET